MDSIPEENSEFTCLYCSGTIALLNNVPHHNCFFGKEVYMYKNILYTRLDDINDILSSEESYSHDQNQNQNKNDNILPSEESLFQSENENNNTKDNTEKLNKQDAVWTKSKTLALLSLYEANVNMLDNPRRKTKIWTEISRGLEEFNIKMTSDQVRWRINYLMKKYKECIDNNLKSGRGTVSFEFFDEMENIFGYKKASVATYTMSSNLPSKKNSNTTMEIQSHTSKKPKIKNLNYIPVKISSNTSASILASTSTNSSPSTSTNTSASIVTNSSSNDSISFSGSQFKNKFENFCLQYMQKEEKRREERCENISKTKKALKLKKYSIEIREKELEIKKIAAINKIRSKEKRHDEILEIEKVKCDLLKRLLHDKENFKVDSDSE